ncbi:nitrate- and nitrite sensing domain-containing protein, partial [Nocardia puris]
FATLGQHLSGLRAGVDVRQVPAADAYAFYNRLLDVVTVGTQVTRQSAPSAEVGVELTEGMRMLYAAEAMSKANALAVTLADGGPPAVPVEELLYQIGFYHTEIGLLAADIDNEQREAAAAL